MQYGDFGQFIRKKRENLRISLNSFAFDCGIDPATLSNFETGKSDILFGNVSKVSKGFKIPFSELIKEYEIENIQ